MRHNTVFAILVFWTALPLLAPAARAGGQALPPVASTDLAAMLAKMGLPANLKKISRRGSSKLPGAAAGQVADKQTKAKLGPEKAEEDSEILTAPVLVLRPAPLAPPPVAAAPSVPPAPTLAAQIAQDAQQRKLREMEPLFAQFNRVLQQPAARVDLLARVSRH